jgi:16S rRNA (cytosine967-C5)-methyltransferase
VSKTAREIALEVVNRVQRTAAYSNIVLSQKLKSSNLSRRDKAFVTELVNGTLRNLGTLDWIIKRFSNQRLDKIPDKVLDLLRLGTYQLVYLENIPAHASVFETVAIAKKLFHRGIASFVNGLLRNIEREKNHLPWPSEEKDPIKYIVLRYSHPGWLVKMWVDEFGVAETKNLCQANNQPRDISIRVNYLKTTPDKLVESLTKKGWWVKKGHYLTEALIVGDTGDISELAEFKAGYFSVQDEGSMIVSHIVSPKPTETILDACAAPGGKATHLAELLNNNGLVISMDINESRLKLVEQTARRLGTNIVVTVKADATQLSTIMRNPVHKILVDAPCTGLGVLARRPDARWRKTPEQIQELAKLQFKLLDSAAPFVKTGGALIYSVCTITKLESEEVIERFLREHPAFRLGDVTPYLPEELKKDVKEGMIQLLPHKHGTDGIFIARLERIKKGV